MPTFSHTQTAPFNNAPHMQVSAPQALPEHGVTVAFVTLPNTKLELLEPLGPASPIAGFLARNPAGGVHHLCLEVREGGVRSKRRKSGREIWI